MSTPSPAGAGPEAEGRRGHTQRALDRAVGVGKGLAGIMVAVGLWEAGRALGVVDGRAVPAFVDVVGIVASELAGGALVEAATATLQAWALGLLLAVVLAIPAGLAVGRVGRLEEVTRPVVEFVRPIPSVAFIPVAIILLGIGLQMKVALVAFACFWPILFNAKAGAEGVDPMHLEVAVAAGLDRSRRFLRIVVPTALPAIATGVRIAAAIALIVTITVEFVAGRAGLGFYLETSRLGGAVTQVWGGVVAAGLLGYLIAVAFLAFERRALRWSARVHQ